MASIPPTHRQLSRQQILTEFTGQERPLAHVQLIRLDDPAPTIVFEGEREIYLQWSTHTGGRRPRPLKADEPRELVLISMSGGGWAEYAVDHDLSQDGDLVNEEYLMRVYAIDGTGPTIEESHVALGIDPMGREED